MVAVRFYNRTGYISIVRVLVALIVAASAGAPMRAEAPDRSADAFDDHRHMMDQLGIKSLRPGANPNDASTYDEENANRYRDSMPDALVMNDGTPVTTKDQWPQRRAELVELFEREIYGRIPEKLPAISWEVTKKTRGVTNGTATITRELVGRVDNRGFPEISVDIQVKFTMPAESDKQRPIMIEFGGFGQFARFLARRGGTPWTDHAIRHGWAYGSINPTSIQPDNNNFRAGIIGLTNKGQPRKPDDWGALRAWAWGVSQLIDCFTAHPEWKVDPNKVGIVGVSRYGKAALVTQAFDPRVAVALVASSGEGGVKLHRHIFGERVENLTGGGYYWMAGNFIKYGAKDADFGEKTAADLPVDSHELIALCAPRPCFISYGSVEGGDPHWVDARGSVMAAVLAGPVYRLLGAKDLGTPGDYLTEPMPPVNTLIGGQLAWRQHDGGHEVGPNWPVFFEWVAEYVAAPPPPKQTATETSANDSER
jgi:hypothetical protein